MSTPIEADSLKERELSKLETAGSVVMTKELFEKLYLSPQTNVAGNLRKTFGNPTPLGLAGFLLSLTPLACDLMEWRGAGAEGAASVGVFYFLGGVVALLVAIGEFILGNSFSVVMFGTYGGFFLAYGATLTPSYNAAAPYAVQGEPAAAAPISPGFLASIAYFFVFMAVFNFVMLICSTRTNAVYFLAFVCLECTFCFVAAGDFYGSTGDLLTLQHFNHIAGGFAFGASMSGWYLFTAEMFALVDFPFQIPVGDLSNLMKGASARKGAKNPHNMV